MMYSTKRKERRGQQNGQYKKDFPDNNHAPLLPYNSLFHMDGSDPVLQRSSGDRRNTFPDGNRIYDTIRSDKP